MSNLSSPNEDIVLPELQFNPTRNNKSGVTPVPDEFTDDDLQRYAIRVKSKRAELISNSNNLIRDYSEQVCSATSNSAHDLQVIEDLRAQREQQPPLWFTTFERRLETRFSGLETSLNQLKYLAMKSENERKRSFNQAIDPIPFLDGSNPPENLHIIRSVDDIQHLSKRDVLRYLNGYGIQCATTEAAAELKYKLRAAVGLSSLADVSVVFTSSGNTRGS